ncbi:disease resistance protein RGA2-like [Phoenix dactylifera]|uniref:Disease resistance protein RGA2-like n=1 Tax=Phoenix dactylifera TaxID=42345 RepID=A0A8B9AXV2_PHODC|nr:disease resistance protein RGA2-like [Phoenix dactylifera]XP_038988664.1 disease resistance protein RGA2-like [Phoenix dactylifera]
MADVLFSALLPVVMEKATDHVLQQFGMMWGIHEKLEKLERMLSAILDRLGDAEERQVKEAGVKSWLAALKNAAYEADDILDYFNVEAKRRKAEIQIDMTKKVRSFFSLGNPVSFRLKMGRELHAIVEKIEKLVDEGNKFGFTVKTQPQKDRPQTHSYVDESEVIGREEDKAKIVELLLDHDNNRNVAVLPIVGMGGLGKTTLAQLIYKDETVEKHFEPRMWVFVSDEFDVKKLAKDIIASAAPDDKCDQSDMDSLQRRLREVVSGKRYLLVLDDIWNEDQAKWTELKTLLETGGEGSRIVVTTRSERASSIMGTLGPYRPECLTEDDSWALFKKKAFEGRAEEPKNLVNIGKEIVKKCGGLPLAVKTLGGLMQSKSQEREWLSVRDSEIWDLQGAEDRILAALRLSYSHLPSHLKQCFAFCAIFPKDYVMQKDLLIQLWMANGFIPSDGRKALEDKGQEIFNELAWRSFFQDIKEAEEDGALSSRHELYYVTTCKMHDLMHDLAQSIMGNECLSIQDPARQEDISTKARHLFTFRKVQLNNYPNILTLRCWGFSASMPADSLKPKSLRALDLHYSPITRLPIPIEYLKHLRYLDLSYSFIEALPDATSTLFNLQTLKLSRCKNLHKLPKDMRNMSSLRHLYIDRCPSLKQLPAGIRHLSSMRTLTKYIVGNDSGRRIGELNSLNLGGLLELYNLRNVRDAADAKEANLSSKPNLCSLILCWDMTQWNPDQFYGEDVWPTENAEEVLEALRPHDGLKLLTIWRYEGGSFPTWMMDTVLLQNVVEIHLGACPRCQHLPPLWQLPSLKFLCLFKMHNVKHIYGSTIYGNASNGTVRAFPSLKRLVLHTMQSLEKWSEFEGTAEVPLVFPHLAELEISNCPNLMTMPELPSLQSLKMKGTTNKQLGLICSLTTLSSLTSLLSLRMDSCDDLVYWPEAEFRGLNSLKNLSLYHCKKLVGPSPLPLSSSSSGDGELLPNLEELDIGDCDGLLELPKLPASLKSLHVDSCPKLNSLTEGLPLLPNLEELDIEDCDGLLELPKLPASLKSLDVDSCPKLNSLSECLRHATALEHIYIWSCPSLTSLPVDLGHLTALKVMSITNLPGLKSLPQGLGQLAALKSLRIGSCSKLSSLPEGMHGLTALQNLSIWQCPQLSSLPEGLQRRLPGLLDLNIEGCPNLERKCKRGGPYWYLISRIPSIEILSERSNFSTSLPSFSCFRRPSTV